MKLKDYSSRTLITMKQYYLIYCRKSSEAEEKQAQSITDQLNVIKELQTSKQLKVLKTFTEEKSAKAPGRPIFNQMLELIQNRSDIKGIISWKLNRLSRNPIDSGTLQWLLQSNKIEEIITPSKTYTEADSDFIMAFEGAQSNKFIRDLREDTIRGQLAVVKKGNITYKAPVGYKNNRFKVSGEKDVSTDPDTFPLLKKVFQLALTGQFSLRDLSKKASEIGLSANGKSITKKYMQKIIHNPFYCGKVQYKRELYQGAHTPMLTESEFDLLQNIYGFKDRRRGSKHDFLFNKFIKCSCGGSICGDQKTKKYKNGTSQVFVYYRCAREGVDCPRPSIRDKDLLTQVTSFLKELELKQHYVDWFIKWLNQANKEKLLLRDTEKKALEQKLSLITAKIDNLLELKLSPDNVDGSLVTIEEYNALRAKLLKEKDEIKLKLENWDKHFEEVDELTARSFDFASKALGKFNSGSTYVKRTILEATGSNLVLNGKQLDITPRLPFEKIKNMVRLNLRLEPNHGLIEQYNSKFSEFCGHLIADLRTYYTSLSEADRTQYRQWFI